MTREVQYDAHGRVKSWDLYIPELAKPIVAILDCPERLYVAWHRTAGAHRLLDENGDDSHGFPPQADLWEVREYRRVSHAEGWSATYERVVEDGTEGRA